MSQTRLRPTGEAHASLQYHNDISFTGRACAKEMQNTQQKGFQTRPRMQWVTTDWDCFQYNTYPVRVVFRVVLVDEVQVACVGLLSRLSLLHRWQGE